MSNRTQTHVPAVDTTTTGHLPYAVQTVGRERHSVPVTDGARGHDEQPTTCTTWPGLCTDTTPGHYDHYNHNLTSNRTDWPVSLGFVANSESTPALYVDAGTASDFPADQAPEVAAQLRAAADSIEAMQAKVENAGYLPALRSECERLGLALQLTDDLDLDLPELKVIDGVQTVLARADSLGIALDDVRGFARTRGRCVDCMDTLDDTATPYADLYIHLDGTPIMICQSCRSGRVVAVLPGMVSAALAKTIPGCSSETAEAIAADIADRLRVPAGGVR